MANITMCDPGGDATEQTPIANSVASLWGQTIGTVNLATDIVHGSHRKSIRFAPASQNTVVASGALTPAGTRISFYIYLVALPSATTSIFGNTTIYNNGIGLRLTSAGILQLWNNITTGQIGSNGATLATGRWYRVSIAYTTTSTTVNEYRVFVDGALSISVSNATLTAVGGATCAFGCLESNTTLDWRGSDFYVDNSTSLLDPGDIWITAKRPVANGSLNEFTTQIGASGSGYGSGHSPQVNERPISTTNGWSISNTTKKTEKYTLEAANVGDVDLSNATIVDYMGWIYATKASNSNTPVQNIIVNNVAYAATINATTNTIVKKGVGSAVYPTALDAIGMDSQYTTTPALASLFDCGIMVAYIPRGNFLPLLFGA